MPSRVRCSDRVEAVEAGSVLWPGVLLNRCPTPRRRGSTQGRAAEGGDLAYTSARRRTNLETGGQWLTAGRAGEASVELPPPLRFESLQFQPPSSSAPAPRASNLISRDYS